jgi:DcuC family C4-dicarboxylate transporter
MAPSAVLIVGLVVIALAMIAIARRVDVRLVMFLAALALGVTAGDVMAVLRTFFRTFSSEQFVVPICCSMGFAYVLKHTGCDQHLVQLLAKPLRIARPLVIPGAVCVGFTVNAAVISQASTAVTVGTVLIPLLRAARLSPTTIGATLLIGASLGGELLNPGAPELRTISTTLNVETAACVARVAPLLFGQLAVATILFWGTCLWSEAHSRSEPVESESAEPSFRVNPFKAIVPLVPLALLLAAGPPIHLFSVPREWLLDRPNSPSYGVRLIGVTMLLGCGLAVAAAPRSAGASARQFFEGAGHAFTTIVAVIVTAQCFGKGVELIGLAAVVGDLIRANPGWLWGLAGAVALTFAALCGSGMAATQSLFRFFAVEGLGVETLLRVGAVVSIAAAAGRTMSPVAAVVLMSSTMTGSQPLAIARRVALPLLAATAVTVALASL